MTRSRKILVIACLLAAGGNAFADDAQAADASKSTKAAVSETRELSREQARKANQAAVDEAAEAIAESNRLDLDIRLIGSTSLHIAENR